MSKSATHPSRSLILCRFPAGDLPRGHFALVRREGIFRTTCVCLEMGSESGTYPSRGCKSVEFQARSICWMICPWYAAKVIQWMDGGMMMWCGAPNPRRILPCVSSLSLSGRPRHSVVAISHDDVMTCDSPWPTTRPRPPPPLSCSDHVCDDHQP